MLESMQLWRLRFCRWLRETFRVDWHGRKIANESANWPKFLGFRFSAPSIGNSSSSQQLVHQKVTYSFFSLVFGIIRCNFSLFTCSRRCASRSFRLKFPRKRKYLRLDSVSNMPWRVSGMTSLITPEVSGKSAKILLSLSPRSI